MHSSIPICRGQIIIKGLDFTLIPQQVDLILQSFLRRARLPIPSRPLRVFEHKGVLRPLNHNTLIELICDNILLICSV